MIAALPVQHIRNADRLISLHRYICLLAENELGYCFASNGHLASKRDVDKATIGRWIARLEALGAIRLEQVEGVERRIFPLFTVANLRKVLRRVLRRVSAASPLSTDALDAQQHEQNTPLPPEPSPAAGPVGPVVAAEGKTEKAEGEAETRPEADPAALLQEPGESAKDAVPFAECAKRAGERAINVPLECNGRANDVPLADPAAVLAIRHAFSSCPLPLAQQLAGSVPPEQARQHVQAAQEYAAGLVAKGKPVRSVEALLRAAFAEAWLPSLPPDPPPSRRASAAREAKPAPPPEIEQKIAENKQRLRAEHGSGEAACAALRGLLRWGGRTAAARAAP